MELSIAQYLLKERNYSDNKVLRETVHQLRYFIEVITMNYPAGFQEHYTRYLIWCDAILNDELYHKAAKKWYHEFTFSRK